MEWNGKENRTQRKKKQKIGKCAKPDFQVVLGLSTARRRLLVTSFQYKCNYGDCYRYRWALLGTPHRVDIEHISNANKNAAAHIKYRHQRQTNINRYSTVVYSCVCVCVTFVVAQTKQMHGKTEPTSLPEVISLTKQKNLSVFLSLPLILAHISYIHTLTYMHEGIVWSVAWTLN